LVEETDRKQKLGDERKFRCARSAERCIRKAVGERGLNPGADGLADATAEDESSTDTSFAYKMYFE
jgi:hypothetical protein